MVGSIFHPTRPAQTQIHSPAQIRNPGQYVPSPMSPYANKSPFVVKTKAIPSGTPKPIVGARRPSLSRTQSAPSKTTAPMFPDEILENLYISDLETARAVLSPNYAAPGRPRVKYVLTLLDNAKDQPQALCPAASETIEGPEFVLKLIKVSDYTNVNILEKFPEACNFIRESLAKQDGGVLVHCRKGVSRSGSVIVAYLMQELGMGFDDALQKAKSGRGKILPNRFFGEQLRLWKDLNYALADETGHEKAHYTEWKAKFIFRPEAFDI